MADNERFISGYEISKRKVFETSPKEGVVSVKRTVEDVTLPGLSSEFCWPVHLITYSLDNSETEVIVFRNTPLKVLRRGNEDLLLSTYGFPSLQSNIPMSPFALEISHMDRLCSLEKGLPSGEDLFILCAPGFVLPQWIEQIDSSIPYQKASMIRVMSSPLISNLEEYLDTDILLALTLEEYEEVKRLDSLSEHKYLSLTTKKNKVVNSVKTNDKRINM